MTQGVLDSAETLHFVPGLAHWLQAQGRFFPDIRFKKQPLACHSEGATRTKAKALKKILYCMPVKPRRPKNLRYNPGGIFKVDLEAGKWKNRFNINERFFVGQ
jgi:hypothetical protein